MHSLPPSSPSAEAGLPSSNSGADEARSAPVDGQAARELHELHAPRQLLHRLRDGRSPLVAALHSGRAADVRHALGLLTHGLDQRALTPPEAIGILTSTDGHGRTPLHRVNVPDIADKLDAFFLAIQHLVRAGTLPGLHAYGLLSHRSHDGTTAYLRTLQISRDQDVASILVRLLAQQRRQGAITAAQARSLLLDREEHRVPGLERFLRTCQPRDAHRPFELRLEAVLQGLLTPEEAVSDLQAPTTWTGGRPTRDVLKMLFRTDRAGMIVLNLMDFLHALNRHEPLSPNLVHRVLHRHAEHGGPLVTDLRHHREALEMYAEGVIELANSPALSMALMRDITGIRDLSLVAQVVAGQRRPPAWLTPTGDPASRPQRQEAMLVHRPPSLLRSMKDVRAAADDDRRAPPALAAHWTNPDASPARSTAARSITRLDQLAEGLEEAPRLERH